MLTGLRGVRTGLFGRSHTICAKSRIPLIRRPVPPSRASNSSDDKPASSGRSRSLDTLDLLLGSTDPTPGKHESRMRAWGLLQGQIQNSICQDFQLIAEDTFDQDASASVADIVSPDQQKAEAGPASAASSHNAELRQADASTRYTALPSFAKFLQCRLCVHIMSRYFVL